MMQGDEGPNAAALESLEHLAIARQRWGIPASFFRLNAAPLQGEAQGVDPQRLGAIEVLFGIAPPVTGQPYMVAGLDASLFLPGGPLVVAGATLYLVCRSEEHTSELQSLRHLVCRLLLE